MEKLGEVVLRQALEAFSARLDPDSTTTLHVNVDAAQLRSAALPDTVRSALDEHCVDPARLVLELTEEEWADSSDAIMPALETLAELGVRFAIDDFGAGHSNFSRMLAIPGLAEVKLDRSIIQNLHDHRNLSFFTGFAATMTQLGIQLIAEGVETENDLEAASTAGIELFQGWLFARPDDAPVLEIASFAEPEATGNDKEKLVDATLGDVR